MKPTHNTDPHLLAVLERIAKNQETQHETLIKALTDIRQELGMIRQSLPRDKRR